MTSPPESPDPIPQSPPLRWLLATVGLAAIATWYAGWQVNRPLTGIDDANIFLTYAKNVAHGEGFVYYPGGERVEGFTSLLWTLICTVCFLLTNHPEPLLLGITILLLAGTMGLVIRSLQPGSPLAWPTGSGPLRWLLPAILTWSWCLLNPKFVIWNTVTLMDSGLWCFLLTAGTLAFARAATEAPRLRRTHPWKLVLYLALALATRPEAMLIGLVWIGGLFVARISLHQDSSGQQRLFKAFSECRSPLVGYLVVMVVLTGFRLAYFGYPLPNTYYAKVSPSLLYNLKLGLGYLRGFYRDQWWAVPGCLVLAWLSARLVLTLVKPHIGTAMQPQRHVIALATLAAIGSPVLAGGDHFGLYRFFQASWPLLLVAGIVPILSSLDRLLVSPDRKFTWCVLVLVPISFCLLQRPWWNQIGPEIQVEFDFAHGGRQLGNRLNELFPAKQQVSLGVITTGGIGFTYEGPLVDLMGLNTVSMGHSPGNRKGNKNHAAFDPEVFFQLSPDLVDPRIVNLDKTPKAPGDLIPAPGSFWDGALQQVHQQPRFKERYRPVVIHGTDHGKPWIISSWCKPRIIQALQDQAVTVQLLVDSGS